MSSLNVQILRRNPQIPSPSSLAKNKMILSRSFSGFIRQHRIIPSPTQNFSQRYASTFKVTRKRYSWHRSQVMTLPRRSSIVPCTAAIVGTISNAYHTSCERAALLEMNSRNRAEIEANAITVSPYPRNNSLEKRAKKWHQKVKRALRMFARAVQLMFTLAPLAALYPLRGLLRDADSGDVGNIDEWKIRESKKNSSVSESSFLINWYLKFCLRCVEYSGAAIVKSMQWASTRPDLFGDTFCEVFSQLQDNTTPHSWERTEEVLKNAYGEDWDKKIQIEKLIGSGCIGQVYKGFVRCDDGSDQPVAIKVMHPNVRQNIDADIDILRFAASASLMLPFGLGETMKWLNVIGSVEKFAELLTIQLDFRREARNLEKFNENFADDDNVEFPHLVKEYEVHPDVLIETFCEGVPILKFAKEHQDNYELRTKLCDIGIRTVVKMIFAHNFIHGDLHPGNIFISPTSEKVILLDVGMVTEYDETEHDRLVSILTSFIRKEGRRAGRLLICDSNERMAKENECALQEEEYIKKIDALVAKAHAKDYLMENLGTYIGYLCDAASTHRVMLNPTFVSAALAIKIQESVVLTLDPSLEVYKISNPIILQTEFKRNIEKLRDSVIMQFSDVLRTVVNEETVRDIASIIGVDST